MKSCHILKKGYLIHGPRTQLSPSDIIRPAIALEKSSESLGGALLNIIFYWQLQFYKVNFPRLFLVGRLEVYKRFEILPENVRIVIEHR